jgi:poly(3-hydroxyalkanoate) synthetase
MVEYLVAQGQQVFLMSWRNPGAPQGHFDLDTYARAVLEARDAVADIAKRPAVNITAACSGGIITAGALGHLAETDRLDEVASLTLFVCALDNARAGTVSALANGRWPRPRSRSRRARATWTGRRSRVCSRGCGPTT